MNPAAIIERAAVEGVDLVLSPAGTIKVRGEQSSVSRWLPRLRQHKADILAVLLADSVAQPTPENRSDSVVDSMRPWKPGNPYTCPCGRTTGFQTSGKPLCPACVPPDDPEQYRKEMLAWADELEEVASTTTDPEVRDVRMSVVTAIRAECSFSQGGE